ncbi:MAG: sucrase ferredoxin [Candidatus Nanopelagicales bacterium]|nr:sucrase ferredoxin [Candidatus Nanopelagicales bacterium]
MATNPADNRPRPEPGGLCSRFSIEVGEQLAGTAPLARAWVVVEQPGAYGRDALVESYLPADVARHVSSFKADGQVRPLLVRRNAGRAHRGERSLAAGGPQIRRAWWCRADPGSAALWSLPFTDPQELLALDLAKLAAGRPDLVHPDAVPDPEPMLLVCTNGARDRCCAIRTRPIAAALFADPDRAERVWECSHLGGHRFAPTAVQLPHGWVHGRLDLTTACQVLDAARRGQLALETARGWSALNPPAQAADLAVRRQFGLDTLDGLDVKQSTGDPNEWLVFAPGHEPARVRVFSEPVRAHPDSCGSDPTLDEQWKAEILTLPAC